MHDTLLRQRFKALAHAVRLAIVELLMRSEKPMAVNEIASRLDQPQSTVSSNLGKLQSAQIVDSHYEHRQHLYTVHPSQKLAALLRVVRDAEQTEQKEAS